MISYDYSFQVLKYLHTAQCFKMIECTPCKQMKRFIIKNEGIRYLIHEHVAKLLLKKSSDGSMTAIQDEL